MKFKEFFRITEYDDERVKTLEYKAYAEAGFIIAILSLIDILIRGIFLDRPFTEWIMSFIILIIYIVYIGIRQYTMNISKENLLEEEEKKKKHIEEASIFISILLYMLWRKVIKGENFIPSGLNSWIQSISILIVIIIVTYAIAYLLTKKLQTSNDD